MIHQSANDRDNIQGATRVSFHSTIVITVPCACGKQRPVWWSWGVQHLIPERWQRQCGALHIPVLPPTKLRLSQMGLAVPAMP